MGEPRLCVLQQWGSLLSFVLIRRSPRSGQHPSLCRAKMCPAGVLIMDLGLLPLHTTEVCNRPGAQWHLPARERQDSATDWLSLVPQEHGESEPRGGALLGCCPGGAEVSNQNGGAGTFQWNLSFQYFESAGYISKRMSERTNYLQAIYTNPFPWEFPPKIMKTSVTYLKRISQHLQAGAAPLPPSGWVGRSTRGHLRRGEGRGAH